VLNSKRIVVVGGGAAGIFAAITAAEADPSAVVEVYERGSSFLSKVKISGGGRCNVTHACFEPRRLVQNYPRGGKALIGPFHRFQVEDTVAWFDAHGVELKTEKDGRMFPVTDDSLTIMEALLGACRSLGVKLSKSVEVTGVEQLEEGGFQLSLGKVGEVTRCDRLLLATGGPTGGRLQDLIMGLGHKVIAPVPSLFTFNIELEWLRTLSGLSVPDVVTAVEGSKLKERGPVLITHWGVSGPGILKLSAWGARELHARGYGFTLELDWLAGLSRGDVEAALDERRQKAPAKMVSNWPLQPIPARLWEQFLVQAGIAGETRWAELPKAQERALIEILKSSKLPVRGKSTNKEEFVTCGGVSLDEVNFKTMESRLVPGLHFAGETLDIDGVTGGFNFQAAWTTGWLAGHAMAEG
jgi:predicted Rossmann fold flavoprotein|tara:strand:+ start:9762 stop:10997 length:1236 start_codon:yes stop_codon:yes gene_type:complete